MANKEQNYQEIRIYGVRPKVKEELTNIAKNNHQDLSSLIKSKLQDVIDSYPEKSKLPPIED